MTNLSWVVYSETADLEKQLVNELRQAFPEEAAQKLSMSQRVQIQCSTDFSEEGVQTPVALIYGSFTWIEGLLEKWRYSERLIFLIVDTTGSLPPHLQNGQIDGVMLRPFRSLALLATLQTFERLTFWKQMRDWKRQLPTVLDGLSQNLQSLERLHREKLPRKFPDVKGFNVLSRYLAGMKSGGDYFDLIETQDQSEFFFVLARSSSYRIAQAFLGALNQVTFEGELSEIGGELQALLKPAVNQGNGEISLVLSSFSRTDGVLSYVSLGDTGIFLAAPEASFYELPRHAAALSPTESFEWTPQKVSQVPFPFGSRLVFVSPGLVETMHGKKKICRLLNEKREEEGWAAINDCIFEVKKTLVDDELPAQDCSLMCFERTAHVLSLMKDFG